MIAHIATFICAAAMALSLSVEASSFFHGRDGSTATVDGSAADSPEAGPLDE